ncbi:MAG: lactate utilization protein [Rhodobiaceae bacterium]|nr:lactate utilization protein [Rhodobiaceae bacterium]
MTSRDTILGALRRAIGPAANDAARRKAVQTRLSEHPRGLIPARGQLPADERIALFRKMLEDVSASVETVKAESEIPAAVAGWLRRRNAPQSLVHGADPHIRDMPWQDEAELKRREGKAAGDDVTGLSRAVCGVAETGTLMLLSGPDNPSTINFLPENHIIVISAADIEGDYESAWDRLRAIKGDGIMPRTVNLVTGPSRSADIEQTLLLGAHGPRALHVIIVED